MDIDTVIADAQIEPVATETVTPEVAEQVEETKPPETTESKEATELAKVRNALNRKERAIGKLTAIKYQQAQELADLRAKVEAGQKPQGQPKDGAPREEDYTDYGEFLEAKILHKQDLKNAENQKTQQQTQQSHQEQVYYAQREQAVVQQAQEFAKANPDFTQLVEEFGDIVDDYSPQLQRLFLEAEHAPLAFMNLAKEGKLEALAAMPLSRAAMEIGRAQYEAKPISRAPAPITPTKGAGSTSKTLDKMSADELMKWVNGR